MKIILKTLLKWFYCTETLVSLLFVVQTNWLQCQVKLSLAWQSSLFGLHCLSQDTDPLSELVCIVTRSSVQRLQRSVAFGNTASLARSSSLFLGLTHCIVQTYQHCISRWAHVWPWGTPGGVRFASTSSSISVFVLVLVAGLALWWEHLPSTNVARVRFPHLASNVDWVCWFSTLLWEVFPPGTPVIPSHQKPTFDLIWFDL